MFANRLFFSISLAAVILLAAAVAAARPASVPARPTAADDLIRGGVPDAAKAAGDTILLMGPFGSGAPYVGDFEDGQGGGAWHGWTTRDFSVNAENPWHVDTYNVVNGQFSAWCGELAFPSCEPGDPDGGYGNNWDAVLEWRGAVADPLLPCQVDVSALANVDTEPGYDYCRLTVLTAGGPLDLWTMDGSGAAVAIAGSHGYAAGDYVGDAGDEVVVQFRFASDGGWSDEDCSWPTAGAIQLDDVTIALTNGVGMNHDFEDGTLGPLVAIQPVGVGDFAQLMNNLQDLDVCIDNHSWQVVFIDDGVVVPGTGGSTCINWCYGPGGYIVNTTGGLAGPEAHLNCGIVSPPMAWPDQALDGAQFAFGVYTHEDLTNDAPGIFETWAVRSTASGDPADLADAPWRDNNFLYYPPPGYYRNTHIVSNLLEPGRTHVQLMLSAYEIGWVWGWNGDDGYPAPYFDNVRFQVFPQDGPGLSAREIDLAQDAFPASGALDAADLGANSVRFDMARNIAPANHLRIDPGDSLVIRVNLVRAGSVLAEPPRLHWRLRPNPVFDAVRTSGLPLVGSVACVPALSDRWAADLPDTGFLFPGDVLHYCFTATDAVGGDLRTAILPADTSGFSDFGGVLSYDPSFTMRALPSVDLVGNEFQQPRVLFWNDFANRGDQAAWDEAFTWNGLRPGRDFDVYYTNGPTSGVGNGLGSRATVVQLAGYEDLVYSSGDLSSYTLGNGDADREISPDVQLLEGWLNLGGRDAFMTGDGLAGDLSASGAAGTAFLQDRLGVAVASWDLKPLIGNQVSPRVLAMAGNPVFSNPVSWVAGGGCPGLNNFDAVTPAGPGVRLAEFADPAGNGGVYPYSAATLAAAGGSRVISLPCDLMFVETDPGEASSIAAGLRVFREVGEYLGFIVTIGDVPGAAADGTFATARYPNPFNPVVRIDCSIARPGRLTVRVFDLRGRLVRTVLDEHVDQGVGLSWDGRDEAGAQAASGVYFYEARMHGEIEVGRMMLLK